MASAYYELWFRSEGRFVPLWFFFVVGAALVLSSSCIVWFWLQLRTLGRRYDALYSCFYESANRLCETVSESVGADPRLAGIARDMVASLKETDATKEEL